MIRCGSYRLSRLEREALRRVFVRSEFELCFHANDAAELGSRIADTPHDVMIAKARELSAEGPAKLHWRRCKTLIAIADSNAVEESYAAMSAGAIATLSLPSVDDSGALSAGPEFLEKFRRLMRLSNIANGQSENATPTTPSRDSRAPTHGSTSLEPNKPSVGDERLYLLIGASTGGPNAIATILHALPIDHRLVILIVQHMEADFLAGFATWLATQTPWPVGIAGVNEQIQCGRVYVAPAHKHLLLDRKGGLIHKNHEAHEVHVPSVNRMFESGAQFVARGVAVLLTGMGDDGALGMASLKAASWRTIAQDQSTSSVFGMPRAAAKLGVVDAALPIQQIAPEITRNLASLRRKT